MAWGPVFCARMSPARIDGNPPRRLEADRDRWPPCRRMRWLMDAMGGWTASWRSGRASRMSRTWRFAGRSIVARTGAIPGWRRILPASRRHGAEWRGAARWRAAGVSIPATAGGFLWLDLKRALAHGRCGGRRGSGVEAIPKGTEPHGVNTVVYDRSGGTVKAEDGTERTRVIYVTSNRAGVFRSEDAGATWTNIASAEQAGTGNVRDAARSGRMGPITCSMTMPRAARARSGNGRRRARGPTSRRRRRRAGARRITASRSIRRTPNGWRSS